MSRSLATFCPSLPSSAHAYELLRSPSVKSVAMTVGTTVLRSVLISVGVVTFNQMTGRKQDLVETSKVALAGAVGIEVFVLAYLALRMPQHKMGAER